MSCPLQGVDSSISIGRIGTPHITSVQYCGGCSILWGDSFSTVGDNFSTVEVIQYSGGIASVLWGDSFSTVEVVQYSGRITSVHAGG